MTANGQCDRGHWPPGGQEGFAARRFWYLLGAIMALACLARLAILYHQVRSNPFAQVPIVDADAYWRWAGQIASGKLVGEEPFFSAPLYPYLLGMIRALGGGLIAVYVSQLIIHLLTGLLIGWLGRARFGAAVGLTAVVIFFLLAEPVIYSNRVLNCSLQLLVVCLFWMQLVRAQRQPSLRAWSLAGALCGLVVLCFSPALLLLLLLGPWVYTQSGGLRRPALAAAVGVLCGLVVIAPAVLHNYAVTGELHSIQAAPAVNWSQGHGPGAFGVYKAVPGLTMDRTKLFDSAQGAYRQIYGRPGTWREIDRHYRRQVLAYWRAHPVEAVLLPLKKFIFFFSARHYDDIVAPRFEADAGLRPWGVLAPLPSSWLMGLGLVGLWGLKGGRLRWAPEWAFLLLPLLVVMVFWYTPRYRFQAVPVVCVSAAVVLVEAAGWRWRRNRAAWRAVLAGVAIACVGETLRLDRFYDPLDRFDFDAKYAAVLGRLDRHAEAVAWLEEAGRRIPGNYLVETTLAAALARAGKLDEAIQVYRRALKLGDQTAGPADGPSVPTVQSVLGHLLIQRGRPADLVAALELFDACGKAPGMGAFGHFGRGRALEKLGRFDQAVAEYRQAVEAAPANAAFRSALDAAEE